MKKITEKDIADALGISRVSVWKVFNSKPGTSPEMRQKVLSKALELGYPIPMAASTPNFERPNATPQHTLITNESIKTIGVAVSRPETSLFWMTILHELAKSASEKGYNLLYIYLPTHISADYQLPSQFSNHTLDGFLVLNIYHEPLLRLLNQVDIPKVFLDTTPSFSFPSMKGDLCLIEGFEETKALTNSLIQQGCSRIGFIGDITYALTNKERFDGYLNAMQTNKLSSCEKFSLTKAIKIDTFSEEIDQFLNQLDELPEAFICANDYLANILWNHLEKRGYQIPKDILISGFDGNAEISHNNELTTVQVNTKMLGVRLAIQLFYRMNYPDAANELIYVRPKIRYNLSTQPNQ